jgi:hypothetical protein
MMRQLDNILVEYVQGLPREPTAECFQKIAFAWAEVRRRAFSNDLRARAHREERAAQRVVRTLQRQPVIGEL